jgi:4-amino-4-deoxy-L-arabinose transferase-like glycosyltransferase
MMPGFKKILSPFVAAVTLLFGAFGGVLTRIAPPDTTGLAIAVGLVPFLLLVIFLLISALSRQVPTAKGRKMWLLSGIAMAALCLPVVFVYPMVLGRYTYVPRGDAKARRIHASDEFLTPAARAYVLANPTDASPARLAPNFESDDMVWERRGMEIAQQRLLGAYAWLVVSLGSAIFCFVQVIGSGAGKSQAGAPKPTRNKALTDVQGN